METEDNPFLLFIIISKKAINLFAVLWIAQCVRFCVIKHIYR